MNICLNCGKEVSGKAKYCNEACRMSYKRNPNKQPEHNPNKVEHFDSQPEQPEQISAQPEHKANKPELTFMGVSLDELDEYFKIGNPQYCELLNTKSVFHRSELPFWLLEGKMDRDSLPLAKSVFLKADEVRRRFRDMMFKFDLRFGMRKNGVLVES